MRRSPTSPWTERGLRHPLELPVFIVAVIVNVAIAITIVSLAFQTADRLSSFPFIAENLQKIHTLTVFVVIAFPASAFLRHVRRSYVRGESIRLSPEQFGAIHEILEAQCARLGMTTVPELYLSDAAADGPARAYTDWKRHYIVLCTDYLEPDPATHRDVLAFQIGCELGRIRLGHTSLVNEVLLSFTDRIPLQAWLLSRVRVYSRDRYGAFLEPEGVRGLAVVATDRIPLGSLNVEAFMRDARAFVGFWSHAGGFLHERPFMAFRVRTLYDLGLFDWEHDLERFAQKGIREDADFPEEPETESA